MSEEQKAILARLDRLEKAVGLPPYTPPEPFKAEPRRGPYDPFQHGTLSAEMNAIAQAKRARDLADEKEALK